MSTLLPGDKLITGKAGPLLIRDGKIYSINVLTGPYFEIRYPLETEVDFNFHGIDPGEYPGAEGPTFDPYYNANRASWEVLDLDTGEIYLAYQRVDTRDQAVDLVIQRFKGTFDKNDFTQG